MRVKKNKNEERNKASQAGCIDNPKGWQSRIKGMDRSLWGLVLAVAASLVMASQPHWTLSDIPFGDGRWYTQQAIQLHGFLHSGQWGKFWDLFCQPSTVTLLPTYLMFFLVPTAWATGPVYGMINCLSWNLLVAASLYGMLRLIGHPRLATPAFLLTAASNYALDGTYFYYLDMPFAAMCLFALFLLLRAFLLPTSRSYLWAGFGAGLVFFVKPGGAFVFIGLYGMAMGLWLMTPLLDRPRPPLRRLLVDGGKRVLLWCVTFLPIMSASMSWNAAQRIIQQWVENQQDTYFAETLTEGGLIRVFYFPLCLSYYYSFALLAVLAVIVILWMAIGKRKLPEPAPLSREARRAMVVLAIVFVFIWGLVFSWTMTFKPIRSLLLMGPVLWLVLFTLTGMRRLSTGVLLGLSVTYFAIAHVQFAWGPLHKVNRLAETYHVSGDWVNRLPAKHPDAEDGLGITRMLESSLAKMGVTNGVVAVGTEMLFWNSCSLNWITQLDDLRLGRDPRITFTTSVDNKGNPIRVGLECISGMILPVHPNVQYSKGVYEFNIKMANQAIQHWQPAGRADAQVLSMGDGRPAVVIVAFRKPLTASELDEFVTRNFTGGYSSFSSLDAVFSRRLPWGELWRLLKRDHEVFRKGRGEL